MQNAQLSLHKPAKRHARALTYVFLMTIDQAAQALYTNHYAGLVRRVGKVFA